MRFLSDLRQGFLPGTDFNDVDPNILSESYGTEGPPRNLRQGQTGAGHYDADPSEEDPSEDANQSFESDPSSDSSDSSDSTSSDSSSRLARDQERHVRHPAIPVPDGNCPFSNEGLETFLKALQQIQEAEIVPENYGLLEDEWEGETYGDVETLIRGRGGREDPITLPFTLWWPRAVHWVQALELMSLMLIDVEQDAP